MKKRTVHVSLPKFRSESAFSMNDTLSAMGMPAAFKDPRLTGGADFSGISNVTDPQKKLYISQIIHKAFVEVSEKGTEAAAVTASIHIDSKIVVKEQIPFTPKFKADRPFIYMIRDTKTGSILFLGRMMNPAA